MSFAGFESRPPDSTRSPTERRAPWPPTTARRRHGPSRSPPTREGASDLSKRAAAAALFASTLIAVGAASIPAGSEGQDIPNQSVNPEDEVRALAKYRTVAVIATTTTDAPTTTTTTVVATTTTEAPPPPPPTTAPPPPPTPEPPAGGGEWSVDWDAIAACESGGNWSINTGNGYYGGLQMDMAFWNSYGGGVAARPDLASKSQQIAAAERAYRSGRGTGPWPTCGSRG